ncbi:MAG TPA: hypothetical protein VFI42_20370 [Thermomicrobiaceae bacterium]|nr:hypothetical protein [Thermomicrobiaceae bacterium]
MRLDERMTAEAIEQVLRREADAAYGTARSARLDGRLNQLAGWLARVAAGPLGPTDEAPDQSGQPPQESPA